MEAAEGYEPLPQAFMQSMTQTTVNKNIILKKCFTISLIMSILICVNGDQSRITVILKISFLCVVCAFGNVWLANLINTRLEFPLFADTYFTVAMSFTAGWLPGIITGVFLTNLIAFLRDYIFEGLPFQAIWCFFAVCILAEIVLVCIFHKKIKPREEIFLQGVKPQPSLNSFIGIATNLLVLVVIDCIVISILGGTVDFFLNKFSAPISPSFEDAFELGLLRNNIPLLLVGILARIPINIVDRFFAIFCGYGLSLIFRKFVISRQPAAVKRVEKSE